ncbi:FtsX-like permease family protein [Aeromonas fluvialis]|uniref:FtsX-like permease family protein n=1 Tax=Aeromonas fluvialis TaxID=591962 RepID=UPI0012EDF1C8|nr:ABC transporter permease [Aeromonas fluvialis]
MLSIALVQIREALAQVPYIARVNNQDDYGRALELIDEPKAAFRSLELRVIRHSFPPPVFTFKQIRSGGNYPDIGGPPDAFDKLSAEEARLVIKAPERISAMLVALDQRAAALFMQAHLGSWPAEPLSAVMPGPALLELWEIVGVAENVLRGMSWCVITVVLVGMLTVLWSGLEERRREMAVLRAVGARPRHIFLLIIGEALLLTLGGVLVGMFCAALTLSALESTLVQRYGLSLSAAFTWSTIVPLFSGMLAAGLLAGLLPAMRCYRRTLSDGLSPETGG